MTPSTVVVSHQALHRIQRLIYLMLFTILLVNGCLWFYLADESGRNTRLELIWLMDNCNNNFTGRNRYDAPNRPPLDSLVQGYNVTGNVSWLLDFAIVGFPKTGTSTLLHHLRQHREIQMLPEEVCLNSYDRPFDLTRQLYQNLTADTDTTRYKRGLKCPIDLDNGQISLPNYERYWPNTKLIVGLRHPVLWMESFYNFRIHEGYQMPVDTNQLIGFCRKGMHNVCTFRATFHLALGNMGKTNVSFSEKEQSLVAFPQFRKRGLHPRQPPAPHPVFLYEVTQYQSSPQQVFPALARFLGLSTPLSLDVSWIKPTKNSTRQRRAHVIQEREARKIDICAPQHTKLHQHLMTQATTASQWILGYFVPLPDVTVSGNFVQLLERWKDDPCEARRRQQQQP